MVCWSGVEFTSSGVMISNHNGVFGDHDGPSTRLSTYLSAVEVNTVNFRPFVFSAPQLGSVFNKVMEVTSIRSNCVSMLIHLELSKLLDHLVDILIVESV